MDIRVAGVSYHQDAVALCNVGDDVLLEPEPSNPVDPGAVRVLVRNNHIGYIPRYATDPIRQWLEDKRVRSVGITGIVRPEGSGYVGVKIGIQVAPIPLRDENEGVEA